MTVNKINITNNNQSLNPLSGNSQSSFLDPEVSDQFSNLDLQRNQVRDDQQLELTLNQAQDQAHRTLLDAQNQVLFGSGQRAIESGSSTGSNNVNRNFSQRSNFTDTNLLSAPGQGGGLNAPPVQSPFIESAKALLRAVLALMVSGAGNNNPFPNIAKLLTGKSMIEVAKTLTEAGMTDEVVNGNPMLRHEALDTDTKAAGLRGIFETAIQYWNQAAQANKQIEKDTHQLAQRA